MTLQVRRGRPSTAAAASWDRLFSRDIERAPRGARHYPCVWCGKRKCLSTCDACGMDYECFVAKDEDWNRLSPELRDTSLCAGCFTRLTGLTGMETRPARGRARGRVRASRNMARGARSTYAGSEIEAIVTKYMQILGIEELPRPRVLLRSNLGSGWLGRDRWTSLDPGTTTIELQRSILHDPRTLERVVAHEVIHHDEAMSMTPEQVEMLKIGVRSASHGEGFLRRAAVVNAAMGEGFVTVKSDKEYVKAPKTRPFLLLVVPFCSLGEWKLGWAWGSRLSADGRAKVERQTSERGARIVTSTDARWTEGAKIQKYGGLSMPRSPEEAEALKRIFLEGA